MLKIFILCKCLNYVIKSFLISHSDMEMNKSAEITISCLKSQIKWRMNIIKVKWFLSFCVSKLCIHLRLFAFYIELMRCFWYHTLLNEFDWKILHDDYFLQTLFFFVLFVSFCLVSLYSFFFLFLFLCIFFPKRSPRQVPRQLVTLVVEKKLVIASILTRVRYARQKVEIHSFKCGGWH